MLSSTSNCHVDTCNEVACVVRIACAQTQDGIRLQGNEATSIASLRSMTCLVTRKFHSVSLREANRCLQHARSHGVVVLCSCGWSNVTITELT
jgi:hypothetical protein